MQTQAPVEKEQIPSIDKCQTGIKGLDEILEGGLPQGRPTLICGSAGCGKTLMACEFLINGIQKYGEPGVLIWVRRDGQPARLEVVFVFSFDGEQIARIWAMRNPDKLAALQHQLPDP